MFKRTSRDFIGHDSKRNSGVGDKWLRDWRSFCVGVVLVLCWTMQVPAWSNEARANCSFSSTLFADAGEFVALMHTERAFNVQLKGHSISNRSAADPHVCHGRQKYVLDDCTCIAYATS